MTLDPDNRAFLLGDGLFETLLWSGRRLRHFEAHLARLTTGCAVLGLPAPAKEELERAALAAIEQANLERARAAVRLTWTAGAGGRGLDRPEEPRPRLFAAAHPAPRPTGPARLAVVEVRRNEGSPASRLKTLAYLDNVLARRAARLAGADEAVMLNNRGEVACAAAANLFWFDAEILTTPALACGALDGITRRAVLAAARALGLETREVRGTAADLARASGVFLTNSLIGARPAATLDGAPIAPHPAIEALAARLGDEGAGV